MTISEKILADIIPEWDGDDENKPILSKRQVIEFGREMVNQLEYYLRDLTYCEETMEWHDGWQGETISEWFNKELKEDQP